MSNLTDRIRTEPVLVTGVVQAALVLAASFGLNLSPEQTGAILAATTALLAFVARSKVIPVSKASVPEPGVLSDRDHGLPETPVTESDVPDAPDESGAVNDYSNELS